jgi:hypothetical protein
MNQSTKYTTDSTETIAPTDLGTFKLKPILMAICGLMASCLLFILVNAVLEVYERGLTSYSLKMLPGMVVFTSLTVFLVFRLVPISICDGKIRHLLKSMKYEDVMALDVLKLQGKYGGYYHHLVFHSFSGQTLVISDSLHTHADSERIRAWAELYFMPGTQWLTHNFELYYQRNPEAHPERIAAKF